MIDFQNLPCKDKIYFRDDSTVIYCADCKDILPYFEDKSFDLVLTDPPYGLNSKIHDGGTWSTADKYDAVLDWDYKPNKELLDQVRIKATNSIIWGGNYFTDILPLARCWVVWCKPHFPTMSEVDMAWTDFDRPAKVYHFPRVNPSIHPTQKPEKLFLSIIRDYSKENDLILDPFLGSGTTTYCANKLNRKSIGIEISEKYCEIAVGRLRQGVFKL